MFKRILVPLDGSATAEQALPHAQAMARQFGSHLILLRVTKTKPSTQDREERVKYLNDWVSRLQTEGLSAEAQLEEGDPAQIIVDEAESEKVDLVVMCSHGRSGLSRWVYGSVAERVLNNVHCPLFFVRNQPQST